MNYDGEISIRYEKATMEDADTFFSAVADGDYETMIQMLDEGRSDVNQTDSDGFSALMISASEGHEKIVEELIKRGCNVNSVTLNKNNTPLFFAAKGGNVNIGKMILAKNKKLINQCNILGETPLLWACYSGQYDFFMFLLSQKAEIRAMSANDTTCLIGACLGQEPARLEIVKHILKLVPKMIDVQDVDGQSALHVAASIGNLECVKYLIKAGADNTLRDVQGLTPLQIAENACFPDCVEVLEAKWKELEDIAKEEMEAFLRAEGYTDDLSEKRGKKRKNRKNKKQEMNQIHPDYQCDSCKTKKRIQGIRYCCQECKDYDLCESCFSHVWDIHPHTHFMAYDPPQPDVFGMLKEGPGRPVVVPLKSEKVEVKKVEEEMEVKKVEGKEEEVKVDGEVKVEGKGEEKGEMKEAKEAKEDGKGKEEEKEKEGTETPVEPTIHTQSIEKLEKDENDWTVITEKRKKNRTASTSFSIDHEEKKKRQNNKMNDKNKMNYKKAIQKSLTSKKEKLPTIPTPSDSQNTQTQDKKPTQNPVDEPPVPSVPTGNETPSQPGNLSSPLTSTPFPSDYSLSADKLPLFNHFDYPEPLHFNRRSIDHYSYDLDYLDYPGNQVYYGNNHWWPKTHYGLWREKEMGMEREQWLFEEANHYPTFMDDGSYAFQHNPTYTSEELQRLLEMSNPSARAMGITVSQYLGLDLDYTTDKQLTMLLDMHMEAIKQITSMKVRLAKTNERQRLLYPREVNESAEDPSNLHPSDKV